MDFWDKIVNFFHGAAKIVPLLITGASIVTAVIPNPPAEAAVIIKIIDGALNAVALNIGQNNQATP